MLFVLVILLDIFLDKESNGISICWTIFNSIEMSLLDLFHTLSGWFIVPLSCPYLFFGPQFFCIPTVCGWWIDRCYRRRIVDCRLLQSWDRGWPSYTWVWVWILPLALSLAFLSYPLFCRRLAFFLSSRCFSFSIFGLSFWNPLRSAISLGCLIYLPCWPCRPFLYLLFFFDWGSIGASFVVLHDPTSFW
jgi:hypothetical protein